MNRKELQDALKNGPAPLAYRSSPNKWPLPRAEECWVWSLYGVNTEGYSSALVEPGEGKKHLIAVRCRFNGGSEWQARVATSAQLLGLWSDFDASYREIDQRVSANRNAAQERLQRMADRVGELLDRPVDLLQHQYGGRVRILADDLEDLIALMEGAE